MAHVSNAGRIAAAAGVVAAAVILFLVLRPGDDDEGASTTTAPTTTAATTTAPATTTRPATTAPTTSAPVTTTTPAPAVTTFRIAVPAGGPTSIARWRVKQGERVVIVVRLASADEIHLHGYDLSAPGGPGQPARLAFRATTPGRFEIELHETGRQIAELRVDP
jgi:hypothetical protein